MEKLKDWKKATSTEELIEFLKENPDAKSIALRYFCDVTQNIEIVDGLLKSGLYTPEEVANLHTTDWSSSGKITPTRQLVVDFVDSIWQNSNDVELIYNLPIRVGFSFGDFYVHKMRYFEKKNPDMYFALIDRGFNDGSKHSHNKQLAYLEMIKHYDRYKESVLNIANKNAIFYTILVANAKYPEIAKDFQEYKINYKKSPENDWRKKQVLKL